jgi:hypothetical protein
VSVLLYGGPLDGERREWIPGRREVSFPAASIVSVFGVRFTADDGVEAPLVIERATYRLHPLGESLGRSGAPVVARYVGP